MDVTELWPLADDIAVHLGVAKDTVHTWTIGKRMAAHKTGRLCNFQAGHVDGRFRRGVAMSGKVES